MGSQNSPFASPFVTAPWAKRDKGYAERFMDDLSNITLKQTLGLPLSVPLTTGVGGLKGASFGLLDFSDEAQDLLGDFALPKMQSTALDIAGQIGGSLVPYVAAGKVAGGVFKGLSLSHKLATGAFTFGAPELARQALTQEFDPTALARSTATGAAFALPLPRIALAPAVAGTELLFGATPLEAGAAGLFAGLFGPMGKERKPGLHQERPASDVVFPAGGPGSATRVNPHIPEANPSKVVGPSSPLFPTVDEVLRKFTTGSASPQARAAAREAAVSEVALGAELENSLAGKMPSQTTVLDRLTNQPGAVTQRQKTAAATGQLELPFPPPKGPQTQLELLASAGEAAGPQEQATLRTISAAVKEKQAKPVEALMAELNSAIDTAGPESVQARVARLALAEKQGRFVPPGAPMRNPLTPPVRGLNLLEPGPNNPYEMRASFEDLMFTLRANGEAAGRTREAQLWESILETRQATARARGRGQELDKGVVGEAIRRQEELLSTKVITFKSEQEAYRTALLELGTKGSAADVDAFVENLPEYYGPHAQKLLTAGREQKRMLVEVEKGAQTFRKTIDRQPAGFKEFMGEASDAGLAVKAAQRQTTRAGKPRTVIDKFELVGAGGQTVKKFSSIEAGRKWLRELEAGPQPLEGLDLLRRTVADLRRGKLRTYHGTPTENARNILEKGFTTSSAESRTAEGLRQAALDPTTFKGLPKQLRADIERDMWGAQTGRDNIFSTDDLQLASTYAGMGGAHASAIRERAKLVKTALDHGWNPREFYKAEPAGEGLQAARDFLHRKLGPTWYRDVPDVDKFPPLETTVLELEVAVPATMRARLLAKLEPQLAKLEAEAAKGIPGTQTLASMAAKGLLPNNEIASSLKRVKVVGSILDPVGYTYNESQGIKNIHELRALAHGRGIVIDALGGGELTLTNQLTGETVQGIQTLGEAVEIVRRAPNVAVAAREIGPRVTAHPPLPGSGGIGGLASEQSPPNFCSTVEG